MLQNYEKENVLNNEQNEGQRRKYKKLKLGDHQVTTFQVIHASI